MGSRRRSASASCSRSSTSSGPTRFTTSAQPDFYVYYLAARLGRAYGWAAIYDPAVFLPPVTAAVGNPLPYLNPPELAWLVTPLSFLPYPLSAWIWTGR